MFALLLEALFKEKVSTLKFRCKIEISRPFVNSDIDIWNNPVITIFPNPQFPKVD